MKVVDMHCDTISAILDEQRKGKNVELRSNDLNIDIEKMKREITYYKILLCL